MTVLEPMIRHTFELTLTYAQYPGTRPTMPHSDGDGDDDSDRSRILAWVMESLPGCISDDEDGDECVSLVSASCPDEPGSD